MVLVNKFLLHQPLNRQSKTYAREGIEIDVSTLADRVGACVVALAPIIEAIRAHVMSAERIHADDTTVPVLAKLKTVTGRIWTYVRDDRPFGGIEPIIGHLKAEGHLGRCYLKGRAGDAANVILSAAGYNSAASSPGSGILDPNPDRTHCGHHHPASPQISFLTDD
jgi:Transposase IS66 family